MGPSFFNELVHPNGPSRSRAVWRSRPRCPSYGTKLFYSYTTGTVFFEAIWWSAGQFVSPLNLPPPSPSLFPTLPRAPTDVVDSQLRSQVRRSKLPTKNAIFFRIDSVVLSRDRAAPSMDGSRARHANNLPTGRPTGALNQSQLLRPVLIYSYSII